MGIVVGVSIQGVAGQVVHIVPCEIQFFQGSQKKNICFIFFWNQEVLGCIANQTWQYTVALYCIWRVILNAVKRQTVPWFSKRIG